MDNLSKQIRAEIENVERSLCHLHEAMNRQTKTTVELAAIGTFLHNIYNGIENILKQSLKQLHVQIPKTENWHKELLNRAVTLGLVSEPLADELFEYLAFRHFFVHSYGFMLEESPLEYLASQIQSVWSKFLQEIIITTYNQQRNNNGNN